jgi:hypothetical protein
VEYVSTFIDNVKISVDSICSGGGSGHGPEAIVIHFALKTLVEDIRVCQPTAGDGYYSITILASLNAPDLLLCKICALGTIAALLMF